MSKVPIITIDGLASSGKTTISKSLSNHLGFYTLDSGILYRAFAYIKSVENIDKFMPDTVTKIINNMKFDLIKNVVGALAPTLGSALGGPLGGQAASVIAGVLGCQPDPKSIDKAIQAATPEQMLELKKAEQGFEMQMKELDVDIFKLEVQDTQDARGKFSKDWTARIMGTVVVGGFMGYIFLVTLQPPEQNSEALINLVLGYLGGLASAVISFYFGASNTPDKDV